MKYSYSEHCTQEAPLTLLIPLFAAGSSLQLNPDPSQLPGATVLRNLANGVGGWALIAAMVGVVNAALDVWAQSPRTSPTPATTALNEGLQMVATAFSNVVGTPDENDRLLKVLRAAVDDGAVGR